MPALQPSTWRVLGLGVAVGYTSLGLFEVLYPVLVGKGLLVIEPGRNAGLDALEVLVAPMMGVRDLSIAAALYVFYHARRYREMGVVIVAGTLLCVIDSVAIRVRKGWAT